MGSSIFSRIFNCVERSIIVGLTFILLSSVRSDAMLFRSLFHIITAWYLIESIPYDLLLASSTNAKFLEAEVVVMFCSLFKEIQLRLR